MLQIEENTIREYSSWKWKCPLPETKEQENIIGCEKHETLSTLVKFLKFQLYNLNFSNAEDQDIMST